MVKKLFATMAAICACALTPTSVCSISCTRAAPPSGRSASIAFAHPSPYSAGCSGRSQHSAHPPRGRVRTSQSA